MKHNIFTDFKLHTLHILGLLLLSLTLGSVGVGVLVQINPLFKAFDSTLYNLIHNGPNFLWLDLLIVPFNFNFLPRELSPLHIPSYFYFMFIGTMLYLALFKRSMVVWALFCFVFGTMLAMAITALDWQFVYRERPFVALPNEVDEFGKQAWRNFSSFPSGHSRETALYSTIIAAFIPFLRWPLFFFTLFIAFSRVYLGAHFPTDVIAGVLIGYLTAKTILIIARELQILIEKKKGASHDKQPKGALSDIHQS